ncbi:unnamed protein product [Prunus brigantina]
MGNPFQWYEHVISCLVNNLRHNSSLKTVRVELLEGIMNLKSFLTRMDPKVVPITIGFVKLCLQSLFYDLVHNFYLTIGLGIGQRSEAKTDLEVGAELLKFGVIKLSAIVRDNCLGPTWIMAPHFREAEAHAKAKTAN